MKGGVNVLDLNKLSDDELRQMLTDYILSVGENISDTDKELEGELLFFNRCADKTGYGDHMKQQLCDLLFYNLFLHIKNSKIFSHIENIKVWGTKESSEQIKMNIKIAKDDVDDLQNEMEEVLDETEIPKTITNFESFAQIRLMPIILSIVKGQNEISMSGQQSGGFVITLTAIAIGCLVAMIICGIGQTRFNRKCDKHRNATIHTDLSQKYKLYQDELPLQYQLGQTQSDSSTPAVAKEQNKELFMDWFDKFFSNKVKNPNQYGIDFAEFKQFISTKDKPSKNMKKFIKQYKKENNMPCPPEL